MRVLEIILEDHQSADVQQLLDQEQVIDRWTYQSENGQTVIKAFMQDVHAKDLLNALENNAR